MFKDRHARVEKDCENCGSKFFARVERVQNGQGRFCSLRCANEFQKQENSKSWGFENGKKYWDGKRWTVQWKDNQGALHNTSYAKWWWTLNVGEVPNGYYVSYKDENPENIESSNFVCVPARDIRVKNVKRHIGIKRSEESKKKMSLAKTGKSLSESHRANLSNALKLRWKRGDFLNTIFKDISGDKNYFWRDGSGNDYPKEFNKALKKFIWERDNSICQICGVHVSSRGTIGHIHHIDGYREHNDGDNLILLCQTCHGKIHRSNDQSSPVIMAFRSKLHWNS